LSNNQGSGAIGGTTTTNSGVKHHMINIDYESQPLSPVIIREETIKNRSNDRPDGSASPIGESASDNDNGNEHEEELADNIEQTKLIDDVYDVNAVKPQYELECLRKNWIIDYTKIMEMIE